MGTLFCVLYLATSNADQKDARKLVAQGEILSLDQILAEVKKSHQGRILEVELEHKHGRLLYELELIDQNGIVWELYYDAKSGELLKSKQDD